MALLPLVDCSVTRAKGQFAIIFVLLTQLLLEAVARSPGDHHVTLHLSI